MPFVQRLLLFFIIFSSLFLSACSRVFHDPVYSAAVITQNDLLSGQALFGEDAYHIILPEDNVIALNDQMKAYLDRYVPRSYAETTRVRVLMEMLVGSGTLNMEYDASKTHTAQVAFQRSEGNCLAFSYLFAAFAKERGLKVSFQEVEIPPEWNPVGNELYYLSRHVNIRVHMKEYNDFIVDIDRVLYKPHYKAWKISENHAMALYYSNKGTDYLNDNDIQNAFRYLVKAIKLAPRDAAIWSNLGVMYRMQGLYQYAEKAYFIALKHDNHQRSVLSNLSVLYEQMGELEKAEFYFQQAKSHQLKNPYYRYYQALEAFEGGNYNLSLSHLKAAVKKRENEKKFHDLLGATYDKLGDDKRANQAWEKAKRVSLLR